MNPLNIDSFGGPRGTIHPQQYKVRLDSDFESNKRRSPLHVEHELFFDQGRDSLRSEDMQLSGTNSPGPLPLSSPLPHEQDGCPSMPQGMIGMPNFGPMMGNPNMMNNMMMNPMAFGQYGNFINPGPFVPSGPPTREPIKLSECILFPPPPGAPPRPTRERPLGCRTVFVGGLPEKVTNSIINEMFENCGIICCIRLSKKNFAHVRFDIEEAVDRALTLSGYKMKIGDEPEETRVNTGRIHVDFAQARDDQYEWECKQRAFAREMRHRQRIEEERLRPPSPPPVIPYSDLEAQGLQDRLKGDESFAKATQVLVTWLDRGDCNRRNAGTFYSLVQTTNSHVRRLMTEKHTHEEELNAMKEKYSKQLQGILRQFSQIDKVFKSSTKQKVWDHFSKAQRKNLDIWNKQCQEIHQQSQEEYLNERVEDEMDLSDSDEEPSPKKKKIEKESFNQIKDEYEGLKSQVEAYKNEADQIKHETENALKEKEAHLKVLQQALQNTQQQLLSSKKQSQSDQEELIKLKAKILGNDSNLRDVKLDETSTTVTSSASTSSSSGTSASIPGAVISEREARIIGLVATFLHVHPFGASIDYIWSYLQRLDITNKTSELEDLFERLPKLFKQSVHGVGASIEKRWIFTGFDSN